MIGFDAKVRKAIRWPTIKGVDVVADAVALFCFSYDFGASPRKILTTLESEFDLFRESPFRVDALPASAFDFTRTSAFPQYKGGAN